jgi:hypothetical protein
MATVKREVITRTNWASSPLTSQPGSGKSTYGWIKNCGSGIAYLADNGSTTAPTDLAPLAPGESLSMRLSGSDQIFARADDLAECEISVVQEGAY